MARRIRIERHEGYRLVVGFAAPGAAATTIRSTIFMRPRAVGNARLLRHELVHVRQWHAHGVLGFAARYLGSYLLWRLRRHPHWAAYRRIPFEVEAEWTARRTAPASAGGRAAGANANPAAAESVGGAADEAAGGAAGGGLGPAVGPAAAEAEGDVAGEGARRGAGGGVSDPEDGRDGAGDRPDSDDGDGPSSGSRRATVRLDRSASARAGRRP